MPRISRAQSMDVLSSMATLAGYKAVLMGASAAPRIFPLLMTAAGTLKPARVLIMGVGVAGLQACATAKRLGAVVEAYDVRPAAREQIISVGAKPVELDLDTGESEGAGGYAKEQGEDFLRRQRELMTAVVAEQDIIITTAAIPGAKSPILVTEDMVVAMKPGSVIVDLAAERGGNCDLTEQGKTVVAHDVTILGPENVPSDLAYHASQMYGKNMQTLLELILDEQGDLNLDFNDEIVAGTVVAHQGSIPHPHMRKLLGLPELSKKSRRDKSEQSTVPLKELRGKNMEILILLLALFVLSLFLGVELITKVPPTLHTPLMSGTNAVSGITLVGALLAAGNDGSPMLVNVLGFIAVTLATINVVGGYLVTNRMLAMFKRK